MPGHRYPDKGLALRDEFVKCDDQGALQKN